MYVSTQFVTLVGLEAGRPLVTTIGWQCPAAGRRLCVPHSVYHSAPTTCDGVTHKHASVTAELTAVVKLGYHLGQLSAYGHAQAAAALFWCQHAPLALILFWLDKWGTQCGAAHQQNGQAVAVSGYVGCVACICHMASVIRGRYTNHQPSPSTSVINGLRNYKSRTSRSSDMSGRQSTANKWVPDYVALEILAQHKTAFIELDQNRPQLTLDPNNNQLQTTQNESWGRSVNLQGDMASDSCWSYHPVALTSAGSHDHHSSTHRSILLQQSCMHTVRRTHTDASKAGVCVCQCWHPSVPSHRVVTTGAAAV